MNIDGSFHGYFTHSLIAIICFVPLEIAIQYDLWLFIPFGQSHKKPSKNPSKNRGSLVQATLPNSLRPKSWPFPCWQVVADQAGHRTFPESWIFFMGTSITCSRIFKDALEVDPLGAQDLSGHWSNVKPDFSRLLVFFWGENNLTYR